MHRTRPLVLLFLLLVVFSTTAQEGDEARDVRVEKLVQLVDPARDVWDTEKLQAAAADRLAGLAEWMRRGNLAGKHLEKTALPGSRATDLRPGEMEVRSLIGGTTVARLTDAGTPEGRTTPLREALRRLAHPLAASTDAHFKFKIVGVRGGDGREFSTTVRYEGYGSSSAGVLQQTARWEIDWAREGKDEPPRIAAARLLSYEVVTGPAPLLVDATGSVLPAGGEGYRQLSLGGEFWHGRIDAIGELNLMGHQGIAVGDVNGDGLEDLYVAQGTGLPNKLLVQQPDGSVIDVADEAGVAWLDDTKGVLIADMDNDGDRDLLTAIGPTIVLAKNDGEGRFDRFVSLRAPTPAAVYSLSVADYDLDGDLDIYGTRYVKVRYGISVPLPFHDAENGPTNHLLRNEGEDRYVDVTRRAGLDVNNTRFSLVGAWADYDSDGDPDLYVANDFGRNNLYRNDGGIFTDVAADAGVEDQAAGMGVSWADYDRDGDLDLHVTNMFSSAGKRIAYQPRFKQGVDQSIRQQIQHHALGNSLFANLGDGTFRDVSKEAGVRMGRWGWGAKFVDLNNDGDDDIVVPNGFLTGALEDDL